MKVSRAWLQTFFEEPLPEAHELAEALTYHAFEIEEIQQKNNDSIIEVKVLPDRASDCMSHRGIARELATILSLRLKHDPLRDTLPVWDTVPSFSVTVESSHTERYMAALVRGVSVKPSPEWLRSALESIGQKSINNIVDATNYVMYHIGQPLHAFDFSLLKTDESGAKKIQVRMAHDGEHFTSLSGETYTLSKKHQLITDAVLDEPLALAGIKGGIQAEVTSQTVDILIEAAHFDPSVVRKTSKELKLITDASLRFQNNPSPILTGFALKEVIELIERVGDGSLVGVIDVQKKPLTENVPIDVSLKDVTTLLGLSLSVDDVEKILVRFEWEFSRDGNEFAVVSPWERSDLTIKECFIEEIGRMYDYRNIPSKKLPPHELSVRVNKKYWYIEKIRRMLFEKGYSEVLTYALDAEGEVELANPPATDKAFMRQNLRHGMEKALRLNRSNAPLLGIESITLFEIGTIFKQDTEHTSLCIGVSGLGALAKKNNDRAHGDMLEILEMLDSAQTIFHVEDGIVEVIIDNIITLQDEPKQYERSVPWNVDARFSPWSQYPFVLRDVALWVPKKTDKEQVESIIRANASDVLVRIDLFDSFAKEESISYAWHLVFQEKNRTLTDTEINTVMNAIATALQQHGWQVR